MKVFFTMTKIKLENKNFSFQNILLRTFGIGNTTENSLDVDALH